MTHTIVSKCRIFVLPLIVSGLVGCQEEHKPMNTVENTPSESAEVPQSASSPATPNPALLPIEAKVISMNDDQLIVRNSNGQDLTIHPTPMTLVDAGLKTGDMAEIRYGQDQQPIAIRKIRGDESSKKLSQGTDESDTITGNLAGIQQQEGIYVLQASAGNEMKFSTNPDTLIDESIRVGDQVEVSTSAGNQAIAIRKVRSENE